MTSSSLSGSWSSTIGTLKQRAVPYGSIRRFRFNKSYKVFYVKNVSGKVVRHSLA